MAVAARLPSACVLAACLAGALGSPPALAWIVVGASLLCLSIGPRFSPSAAEEMWLTIACAAVGIVVARSLLPEVDRHQVELLSHREVLFMTPLLSVGAARGALRQPRGGARGTLLLSVLALTAAGGARTGWGYLALAALSVTLGLVAITTSDWASSVPWRKRRADLLWAVPTAAVAMSCVVAAQHFVPLWHERMLEGLSRRGKAQSVGFSDRLEVGGLTSLFDDARVVARLRAPDAAVPTLLRGAVLGEYYAGRWRTLGLGAASAPALVASAAGPPPSTDWLELEHSQRPPRYFLPADAADVLVSEPPLLRDLWGVYHPPQEGFAKRVWFRRAPTDRPLSPMRGELHVPAAIRAPLVEMARAWGADRGGPQERLRAIERRLLRDYAYATASRHDEDWPILDFLAGAPERRRGHCEYFASSLALLGRVVGVPTRLVAGYRVVERSPFGYWLIRRKHAHSWVEAWWGGRWHGLDPTPAEPLAEAVVTETPWMPALVDALLTRWEAADDWLAQRSTYEYLLTLVALLAGLVAVRTLRQRRQGRAGSDEPSGLPGYRELVARLQRLGLVRRPGETLSQFAGRLAEQAELGEDAGAVSDVLHRYVRYRYGRKDGSTGEDPAMLDRDLQRLAGRLVVERGGRAA